MPSTYTFLVDVAPLTVSFSCGCGSFFFSFVFNNENISAVPPMTFYNTFPGFLDKPLELPSLHCIGERDQWNQRSHHFAENAFDSSTREVVVHSGNHKPPSIFEKRDGVFDKVAEFLLK